MHSDQYDAHPPNKQCSTNGNFISTVQKKVFAKMSVGS